jgi:prepilin-type N-terminal cleavage/methylation domain-containing protein
MKEIKKIGFSLIELMIVVAIIAFLSMIAMPSFLRFLAKAKRTEAYLNLSALYTAQKAYWAERGKYSSILYGSNGLGWKPEGNFYYSYGFSQGAQGENFFLGKLGTPATELKESVITPDGFTIVAAGNIYNKNKPDKLAIKETGEITILQDGLY